MGDCPQRNTEFGLGDTAAEIQRMREEREQSRREEAEKQQSDKRVRKENRKTRNSQS